MTLHGFEAAVASAEGIDDHDRIWFPRWLQRYALSFTKSLTNPLPVNRDATLNYSRQLLEAGAPAWQRWQAVRSLVSSVPSRCRFGTAGRRSDGCWRV